MSLTPSQRAKRGGKERENYVSEQVFRGKREIEVGSKEGKGLKKQVGYVDRLRAEGAEINQQGSPRGQRSYS